ncbi:MAG TPA: helix-turn-helix transcriptional regulator [Actinoplanes sp.]
MRTAYGRLQIANWTVRGKGRVVSDTRSAEDTSDVGPFVARSRVSRRLVELREQNNLTTDAVVAHTGWSSSKLTRIERSEVTIQPLELRALLSFYGVEDEDEVATLARLSQTSRSRQWYSKHRLHKTYQQFVAFETEAAVLNASQLLFFPGLLQTEEYAKEITALSMRRRPDDAGVLARVELRMDRQQAFQARLGKRNPPHFNAMIDEAVLRRPVGGRDCLRRQLDHLLDLAADGSTYSISVTPLDLVHHSGLGGSFELLQFEHSHDDVLFTEGAAGVDSLTTDPVETERFRGIVSDLRTYGLGGEEALEMIRSIRAGLPRP